jgi:hypothetical protein
MNDQLKEIVERARKVWRAKVISTLPKECSDADFDYIITRACQEWSAHGALDLIIENQQLRKQLEQAETDLALAKQMVAIESKRANKSEADKDRYLKALSKETANEIIEQAKKGYDH